MLVPEYDARLVSILTQTWSYKYRAVYEVVRVGDLEFMNFGPFYNKGIWF